MVGGEDEEEEEDNGMLEVLLLICYKLIWYFAALLLSLISLSSSSTLTSVTYDCHRLRRCVIMVATYRSIQWVHSPYSVQFFNSKVKSNINKYLLCIL